jgi:hypothetical protein
MSIHVNLSQNQRHMLVIVSLIASMVAMLAALRLAAPASRHIPEEAVAPASALAAPLDLGTLPLVFEPNGGQTDPAVRFMAHAPGGILFFTPSEVVLALSGPIAGKQEVGSIAGAPAENAPASVVRMQFIGATAAPAIEGGETLPGRVSYLLGNDPANWQTNLPTFQNIVYRGLYPGVDLAYTGTGGRLKGTYTIAPGADSDAIRWSYPGAGKISVDSAGNLQIVSASTIKNANPVTVIEQAPVAWQEVNGRNLKVSAHYVVAEDGAIAFRLGSYDPALPLIIDPTLEYSSYLGGSLNDQSQAIAVSGYSNDALITGSTLSTNFPTTTGSNAGGQDAFVTRVRKTQNGLSLVFSIYLGGSGNDIGYAIADGVMINPGIILIAGATTSTNFPVQSAYQGTNGGGWDAFVVRLSESGAFEFSTYLGGSSDDLAYGIGTDPSPGQCCPVSYPYVTGSTLSTNFPTQNAYQGANAGGSDAFLTKLSTGGNALEYSTYLGGSGNDVGNDVAVNDTHDAYLTGQTNSTNFPSVNAYQPTYGGGSSDAFAARFLSHGLAPVYSTYLGGSGSDAGNGIGVDTNSNAHIVGATLSGNFPTSGAYQPNNGGLSDAFVTKLVGDGTALAYSTYLGGSNNDEAHAVAVDVAGLPHLAGWTQSSDFPLVSPIQPSLAGGQDAFVSSYDEAGAVLLYSTYLGGSSDDLGLGVAVPTKEAGIAYVSGYTASGNFPVAQPYQASNSGGQDAFFTKINAQCGVTANYTFTQSTGAAIVPGTDDVGNHCDNCSTNIQLPFPVRVYERAFESARVSSNGVISFAPFGSIDFPVNLCLPFDGWGGRDFTVMPHWDQLRTDCTGCGIFTSVSGSAPGRIFNVEWRTNYASGGGTANFEARFYESGGRIDFIYGTVSEGGNSATVGMQRTVPGYYVQYECDTGGITPGLQLVFTQPACVIGTPIPTVTGTPPTATPTNTVPTATRTSTATATRTSTATALPSTTGTPCPDAYGDLMPGDPDFASVHCVTCRYIMDTYECGTTPSEPCNATNDPYFRPNIGFSGTRGETARSIATGAGFVDPISGQTYEDVPPSHPYYVFIERMTARGLMSGFPCGITPSEPCIPPGNRPYFRPDGILNRGQYAKVLSETMFPGGTTSGQVFEDVPSSHTFYVWINRLGSEGIMLGFPCGTVPSEPCGPENRPYFRPNNPMTDMPRVEYARMMVRAWIPDCPQATATPTATAVPTNSPTRISTNTPVTQASPTATPCAVQFTDVPSSNTFYAQIRCLVCRGIMGGYADGTFRPNNDITRGQLSKIVANSASFNEPVSGQSFEDVEPDNTFYVYVERMAGRGIIGGYNCGGVGEPCGTGNRPYFRPNANATRGQISKIVSEAAGFGEPQAGQTFEDVAVGSTFHLWIERLASRGIMGGYPCGGTGEPCGTGNKPYFRPNNNATRGQTSKIVANAFYPNCQTPARH